MGSYTTVAVGKGLSAGYTIWKFLRLKYLMIRSKTFSIVLLRGDKEKKAVERVNQTCFIVSLMLTWNFCMYSRDHVWYCDSWSTSSSHIEVRPGWTQETLHDAQKSTTQVTFKDKSLDGVWFTRLHLSQSHEIC